MSCNWVFTRGQRAGRKCGNPSRGKPYCKEHTKCTHGTSPSQCTHCGGARLCEHGVRRSYCRPCGGKQVCPHNRNRSECRDCGGSQICVHGRRRTLCAPCGGGRRCKHGKPRYACTICLDLDLHKVYQPRTKKTKRADTEDAELLRQVIDELQHQQ